MKITISFLLLLLTLGSQGQSTLFIGSGLDLTNNTLSAKTSAPNDSLSKAYTNAANAVNKNTTQDTQIGALQTQVATDGVNIAVLQGSIGTRAPNNQTANYTATQSDAGGCIVMSKTNGILTLPAMTPGTTFTVRNTSLGTISIVANGVTVRTITKGAAYRTVYYLTSTNVDVR